MTTDETRRAPRAANAVTHGLTARNITVPAEDPQEWEDHAASILESYDPQTPLERTLAIRVAELLWRLRRVARSEADAITDHQNAFDDTYRRRLQAFEERRLERESIRYERENSFEHANTFEDADLAEEDPPRNYFPALLPTTDAADHIIRYEAHINRQLIQAMHELEALQSRRHGTHTPLARVDFFSIARNR